MVMSKKTTIVQLKVKISRMMIEDVNKHSGLRGGHLRRHANVEMCSCLGCGLEMRNMKS